MRGCRGNTESSAVKPIGREDPYAVTTAACIVLRESGGQVGILVDGIEEWLATGRLLEIPKTI
jgi:hypothetical protein